MYQFFIVAAAKKKRVDEGVAKKPDPNHKYDAALDVWHSMAYFVAKELSTQPTKILTEWTCEELLVTFGVYANQNSAMAYEMMSKKERYKKKMTSLDRWQMPFVTIDQVAEMNQREKQDQDQLSDMETIAQTMFG